MDIKQFEKLVKSVKRDVERFEENDIEIDPILFARVKNVVYNAIKFLPEHRIFFMTAWEKCLEPFTVFNKEKAIRLLDYILELLKLERTTESRISEMKIFESGNKKIKQAALSFKKDDYISAINNLNTALELVLKDKLEIPTTITKINTSKIIDICVKHKVGPYAYLSEAKKHICSVDNKIKHQGYAPSKIDCINGIKVMEELISKLKDKEIKLTRELRDKIYAGI